MNSRSVKFIEMMGRMVAARTENRMGNEHLLVKEQGASVCKRNEFWKSDYSMVTVLNSPFKFYKAVLHVLTKRERKAERC